MVLYAFAQSSLKEFKLVVVGSLLNSFRRWIVVLQSLLKQSTLFLFEGEVFGMASFAIEIRVSVKCFVMSLLFGSSINF